MGNSKQDADRRFRSIEDVKSEYLPVSSKGVDELVDKTADVTQSALKKHVKRSMRNRD
jgi:hypothetical protein